MSPDDDDERVVHLGDHVEKEQEPTDGCTRGNVSGTNVDDSGERIEPCERQTTEIAIVRQDDALGRQRDRKHSIVRRPIQPEVEHRGDLRPSFSEPSDDGRRNILVSKPSYFLKSQLGLSAEMNVSFCRKRAA